MARVLKLVQSGLSDLSFLAAASSGIRVQKWAPAQAPISYRAIPPYVVEEMDCLVDRSSDDNLAATMQALEEYAAYAEWFWHNRTLYLPVWLQAQMDGETYTRQALVKSIRYDWKSDPMTDHGHAAAHDAVLRVQVERHPYWESLNEYTVASSDVSGASVVHDPSDVAVDGEIVGTVPARPWLGFHSGDDPANLIDRLWIGIRSEKYGDPDEFHNIYECEDGTNGTDASDVVDATASGGDAVEVDFSTEAGWDVRSTIVLSSGLSERGRFLELLRAKVDSSTTVEVYLKIGLDNAPAASYITVGPTIEITNTNYDYYEMGDLVVPPINLEGSDFSSISPADITNETAIEIWARRTSGSGSLHLDCLCPIPIDEGYAFLSDIGSESIGNDSNYYLSVRDESIAWSETTAIQQTMIVSDHNFRFPPGEVRLICVFAQDTLSDITDSIIIDSAHFTRWASLRGADGSVA